LGFGQEQDISMSTQETGISTAGRAFGPLETQGAQLTHGTQTTQGAHLAQGTQLTQGNRAGSVQSGLGAWASAVSADDNAQAAIALAEAINRARNDLANRENRASDARVVAVGHLETLRVRLEPIYAAIPRDVELFDLGMVGHAPPRLFVDIIAFIEMTEDGRGYRFFRESRSGRMLLGETTDEKQMVTLVTHYIAERLVERERALVAQAKPAPLPRVLTPDAVVSRSVAAGPPAAMNEAHAPAALPEGLSAAMALSTAVGASVVKPVDDKAPVLQPAMDRTPTTALAQPTGSAASLAPVLPVTPTVAPHRGGGSWLWPVLALAIGIGLGALALYLYALSLNRL
jgi:hypothetical protein